MATKRNKSYKVSYKAKLIDLIDNYKSAIIISVNNVTSKHVQIIRADLRNEAVLLFGKNTLIKKILREKSQSKKSIEPLIDLINGNCGIVFTNENLRAISQRLKESKIVGRAKPGVVAPNDVVISSGSTGLPPDMTNFFQTLNIPTKIARGAIEITSNIDLIFKGNKVNETQAELLSILNIQPFLFGPSVESIFDDGVVFSPELLELDETRVAEMMGQASSVLAAIGLSAGLPNTASTAHSLRHAMKAVLSAAISADYAMAEAEELKEMIANPEKFAVKDEGEKKEEKKEEVEEEEEESEVGGVGNLFDSEEEEDSE